MKLGFKNFIKRSREPSQVSSNEDNYQETIDQDLRQLQIQDGQGTSNQQTQQIQNIDIIQAFSGINIRVIGTYEDPLFNLNDCGKILEIKNIYDSTKDFTSEQKKIISYPDPSGIPRGTNFLTEIGLYRLIFMSRSLQAQSFQSWTYNLLREIRLKGKEQVQKQLIEAQNREKDLQKQLNDERSQTNYFRNLPKETILYIGQALDTTNKSSYKIGITRRESKKRQSSMSTGTSEGYKNIYEYECRDAKLCEDTLKALLDEYRRYNPNDRKNEYYDCDLQHIKRIVDYVVLGFNLIFDSQKRISQDNFINEVKSQIVQNIGNLTINKYRDNEIQQLQIVSQNSSQDPVNNAFENSFQCMYDQRDENNEVYYVSKDQFRGFIRDKFKHTVSDKGGKDPYVEKFKKWLESKGCLEEAQPRINGQKVRVFQKVRAIN